MSDKLKQALEELRDELKQLGSSEPKLQKLAVEVQAALQEHGADVPLIESLRDTTKTFETRHPQLTALINNVMSSLSNIGI